MTLNFHRGLLIRLRANQYLLPGDCIQEVLPSVPIERLTHCPSFVLGVILVRDQCIPLIDAAERLQLPIDGAEADPHIVCLSYEERSVGFLVDEALDLLDLQQETILSVDELGSHNHYFSGMIKKDGKIIRLLNPALLLRKEEWSELDQISSNEHS